MDRASRSKAAYSLVDLSDLPRDIRDELIADAGAGGGNYGLRVVEEVHNGPAIAPIYGYYHVDEERWTQAKKDLGIGSTDVDDATVAAGTATDPRTEAMLREAAKEQASAAADSINALEEEEVRKIVEGEGDIAVPANAQARAEPNVNIVDTTLNADKNGADRAGGKPSGSKPKGK